MTGQDRIALHAARTGWDLANERRDAYQPTFTYAQDNYRLEVTYTAGNAVARAFLTHPDGRRRHVSRGAGKADRIIDWMCDPAAVFA